MEENVRKLMIVKICTLPINKISVSFNKDSKSYANF